MNPRGIPNRDPRKRSGRQWIWLALLAGCAPGCDLPGQPKASERYVAPRDEMTFDVLFRKNCVGCHGRDGTLGPAPPLNDKLFLSLIPAAELSRVISEGRAGTLMPAFASASGGHLTAEQVKVLADGVKQTWGSSEPAPQGAPPYLPDSKKPNDADRHEAGMKVFARACATCHGDHGEGGSDGDKADEDSPGPINEPDFLALISDQALRRLVITGRPDLGMPDFADPMGRAAGYRPLQSQEVTDLVALLASWRRGGSAKTEGK